MLYEHRTDFAGTQDCTLTPCSWYHWLKYQPQSLHRVLEECFTSLKAIIYSHSGRTVDSTNYISFSYQCSLFAKQDDCWSLILLFASPSPWKSFGMARLSSMSDSRHWYPKAHRFQPVKCQYMHTMARELIQVSHITFYTVFREIHFRRTIWLAARYNNFPPKQKFNAHV